MPTIKNDDSGRETTHNMGKQQQGGGVVHERGPAAATTTFAILVVIIIAVTILLAYLGTTYQRYDLMTTGGSSSRDFVQRDLLGASDAAAAAADGGNRYVVLVDGDYGDCEWDVGYKKSSGPPTDREKYLADLAAEITGSNNSSSLPSQQQRAPLSLSRGVDKEEQQQCPWKTDWQGTFKGYPTTFIDCCGGGNDKCGRLYEKTEDAPPGGECRRQQKQQREWARSLNDEYYRRSRLNDNKWDPYKHHHARQMFAQFLSSNMVNRKAFYERPIEHLEEATCFGSSSSS